MCHTSLPHKSSRPAVSYFLKTPITSALPGVETASAFLSKPGYFGRPWRAATSEVVFYNTTINATNNPGHNGKSLILLSVGITHWEANQTKCMNTAPLKNQVKTTSRAGLPGRICLQNRR